MEKSSASAGQESRLRRTLTKRRASDLPGRAPGLLGLYLAFWHYAAGQRARIVLSSSMLVASELIRLAIPWLAARAIDAVQQGGPGSMRGAAAWVAGILAASALAWAFHGPGRVIERGVGMHIRRRLADGLYARLGRLPLVWHERHHTGETLQRLHKTTSALSDFAQNRFVYLQNAVRLVGPIVAMLALSAVVGVLAAAGYLLIGLLVVRLDRIMVRLANQENEADRRYNAALIEFIGNIQSVLALRLQAASRVLLAERLEQVMVPMARSVVLNEGKWCAVDLLSVGLTWGLVALYASGLHDAGGAQRTLLLGSVFMVYQYAQQASGVVVAMAANLQQFARYRADYASADPILQARDAPSLGRPLARGWRSVRLHGVSFVHGGNAAGRGDTADGGAQGGDAAHGGTAAASERAGLHDVHLAFARGEKLALIGPSGAGKSTLMRVLAGLYQADRGGCTIEGDPDAGLRDLARSATFIPQDTEVFETSMRDNLTLGAPCDAAHLELAAYISALDTVLDTLPQGLDTPIIERGSNLSGGQKQRLALARGLLAAADSDLIMLDEPTSALDSVTEAQVFERMRERFAERTVIASVHRLAVLRHFDRVVLMRAGRIEDAGTLDELRARSALFRQLLAGASAEAPAGSAGALPTNEVARRMEARDSDLAATLAQVAADAGTVIRETP